jgi:hypothetical protein
MAVDSGRRDVPRRRRSGVFDTTDGGAAAGTAAAGGSFRRALYEHASGVDERCDAD